MNYLKYKILNLTGKICPFFNALSRYRDNSYEEVLKLESAALAKDKFDDLIRFRTEKPEPTLTSLMYGEIPRAWNSGHLTTLEKIIPPLLRRAGYDTDTDKPYKEVLGLEGGKAEYGEIVRECEREASSARDHGLAVREPVLTS